MCGLVIIIISVRSLSIIKTLFRQSCFAVPSSAVAYDKDIPLFTPACYSSEPLPVQHRLP